LESGTIDLVSQIQSQQNYAYIRDMHYPELERWATQNGLSKDELALIQPTYAPIPYEWEDVGSGGGHNGEITTMLSHNSFGLVMAGAFTEVDGVACQNIIARDDSGWNDLGGGVNGVVRGMATYYKSGYKLAIVGEFELFDNPGVPVNIAYWDGDDWVAMQSGDMEGSVFCIEDIGGALLIGGDFKKINGETFSNMAFVYTNSLYWTDDAFNPVTGEFETEHAFSTNGAVRTIFNYFGNILVGGDFDEVGTLTADAADKHESKHMAGFDVYGWKAFFDYDIWPVYELASPNNRLYVITEMGEALEAYYLQNGFFEQFVSLSQIGDGKVHGFMATDNQCFMYGGIELNNRAGFVTLGTNYGKGAFFNGAVTAAVEHDGYTYVAGDFDESYNDVACNNLLKLKSEDLTSVIDTNMSATFRVFAFQKKINIQTSTLFDSESISFYNTSGQLVNTHALSAGEVVAEVNLEALPVGIYIYVLDTPEGSLTGKLFIGG